MKSKLLKRLFSVMLVGTAVFSLAACSGGTGEEEQMEPDAEITEGISLGSGEAEDCADEVAEWLANIGMTGEADS